MSEKYIPLYRKYRPQTFNDLIGQEHIKNALSNAIKLGRISHAYLFCGPRGTGKTSSARILAKSLNCKEGPTLTPCGVCPSCVDVTNSTPMDVIEIDAASNRGVDDTQKIIEKVQYVPIHGKYKIYVIDEVHQLSSASFNALLKTLEEPPENVIFILATTEPQKVLETVISRCQRFDFKRITVEDIVKRLKYIAEQEQIKIDDDALYTIAKNSAGGMRDSLSLLDQVSILNVNQNITTADIESLLGKISNEVLFSVVNTVLEKKTAESLQLINKIYEKGSEPAQVIINVIQYVRNLLILKSFTDKEAVKNLTQLSDEYLKKMSAQVENVPEEQLVFIVEKLSAYLKEIKTASNPYMWLEMCFIDLTNVQFLEYSKLLEKLESIEQNGVTTSPVSVAAQPVKNPVRKEAAVPEAAPAQPINEVKEPEAAVVEPVVETPVQSPPAPAAQVQSAPADGNAWEQILASIEHTPSRVLYSSKGVPVELSEQKVVVAFPSEIFVKQAKDETKIKALKAAVEAYFNTSPILIDVRLKQTSDVPMKDAVVTKKKLTEPAEKNNNLVEAVKEDKNYNVSVNEINENEYTEKSDKEPEFEQILSPQANLVMNLFNGKIVE